MKPRYIGPVTVDNIWEARQEWSDVEGRGPSREDIEVRVIGSGDDWSPLDDLDTHNAARVIDAIDETWHARNHPTDDSERGRA